MTLTMHDLFAGAGGSSTGAVSVPGVSVRLAANHWQRATFEEILPDEAAERSRATMWDVCRFTEAHRYQAIIVENVVEARQSLEGAA